MAIGAGKRQAEPWADRPARQARVHCRREVSKPRAQIEALVAERYGEPPDDTTRVTKEAKPTPAEPPQAATTTGVKVASLEPLDGLDPNPRAGA